MPVIIHVLCLPQLPCISTKWGLHTGPCKLILCQRNQCNYSLTITCLCILSTVLIGWWIITYWINVNQIQVYWFKKILYYTNWQIVQPLYHLIKAFTCLFIEMWKCWNKNQLKDDSVSNINIDYLLFTLATPITSKNTIVSCSDIL